MTAGAAVRSGWTAAALLLALGLSGCPKATQPCALHDCDGACVDVRVDGAHCGACGHACQAGAVCSGGVCALSCEAPLSTCAGPSGGRCASLRTDAADCGACGVACPAGQRCGDGVCAPDCAPGLSACGAGEGAWCADLQRDRLNCGACGHACGPGTTCDAGGCTAACVEAGRAVCDGACIDLFSDARHCGACGLACGPEKTCDGATCRDACAVAGLARCDGACRDLSADPLHCGACGRGCPDGGACQGGRCAAPACQAGPSLSGPTDVVGTITSAGLLAADLDGDGLADLLLLDRETASLVLARGLPAGGFGPTEVVSAATLAPSQLIDADGDGALDVLAIGETEVVWLLNDGAGHFSRGESYPAAGMRFARAADLDGDGKLDVLAAESFRMTVWRAGPVGEIETHFLWSARDLAVVDLDGDARPEVVVACGQGLDPVTVLRNQGDGTFVEGAGADPGLYPDALVVADLDGDGRLDVAVRGYQHSPPYADSLAVLRGTPAGFGPAEEYPLPETLYRYALLATDLDGDGATDLVVGEVGAIRIFTNRGDGTFGAPAVIGSVPAMGVAAIDVDRDGLTDLVTASNLLQGVQVRRRLPGGGWDGPTLLPVPADQVLIADVDGDGRGELVTLRVADPYAGRPRGVVEVRRGQPAWLASPSVQTGFGWYRIQAGDLDRDGAAELLVTRYGGPPGLLRWRDGALQPEVPILVAGMEDLLQLADVTGDGVLDLVVPPGSYGTSVRVAPGTGDGRFGAAVETPLTYQSYGYVTLADLDGDGRADLCALTGYAGSTLEVRSGGADGTFGQARLLEFQLPGSYPYLYGPAAADLDGDGREELAFGVSWYRPWPQPDGAALAVFQDEGGALTVDVSPLASAPAWLSAGPVGSAGQADLLVTGRSTLSVLLRQAGGGLGPARRWVAPDVKGVAAAGDLDGDLRPEVALPVPGGLLLYRGGCAP